MLMVLGLMSACIPGMEPPPDVGINTVSETIGPDNTPEFTSGPVLRQARLTIPPGALVGSVDGEFALQGSTRTPEPIPAVEFAIGDPIGNMLVVDAQGNFGEDFEWELPSACDNGCDVVVPVTIEQTGDGEPPTLGWSVSFYVEYESSVPPEAEGMTAVIEPADPE